MGIGCAARTAQCSAASVARSCRSQAHLLQRPLILVDKTPQEDLCPVTQEHSLKPRCNQLWQGQEGLIRVYCQGQLEAKSPNIYIHTPFALMHLQQYPNWHFNGAHTIVILKFLIWKKKPIRNPFKLLHEISTLLLLVKEKELFEPLNIISTVVNFWMVVKKMALMLLLPTCVNKVSSQCAH